ncbi:MAG TPA: hypothetical protein PKZ64_12395 [Spirochaetota bacterium]|nr:hypothetical protein [Spirochaetota bacterium]HPJ43263.1 hypothetical protein [Spirochaetota bacterium]HPR38013.1 hypothetical protein [Spirochaetota bacterium]
MKSLPVIINIFFAAVIILSPACGKKIEAGSPEEVLFLLKEKGGTSQVMNLYTDGTVSSLRRYMKLTNMSEESAADVLGFIPSDSSYEITGKKIEAEKAILTLRFTKHHTENLAGYTMEIKMVKDGKSWKIDRESDFQKLVKAYESGGAERYLKNIR